MLKRPRIYQTPFRRDKTLIYEGKTEKSLINCVTVNKSMNKYVPDTMTMRGVFNGCDHLTRESEVQMREKRENKAK